MWRVPPLCRLPSGLRRLKIASVNFAFASNAPGTRASHLTGRELLDVPDVEPALCASIGLRRSTLSDLPVTVVCAFVVVHFFRTGGGGFPARARAGSRGRVAGLLMGWDDFGWWRSRYAGKLFRRRRSVGSYKEPTTRLGRTR
jgi:hypothetical protein